MTDERKPNGDTPSPKSQKDGSNSDATEKPGLIIEMVLPNQRPEVKRDPSKPD